MRLSIMNHFFHFAGTKKCPNCKVCTPDGECCHKECYGGCYEKDNPSACYQCRNVNNNGECVEKCTGEKIYRDRFCVTKDQCDEIYFSSPPPAWNYNKKKPVDVDSKCTITCPKGFQRKGFNSSECVECPGRICTKKCNGETIDSFDKLKQFSKKGCTSVGSLDVAIHSNQDINEIRVAMEEAFGRLESIEQLYIMRTQALTSMSIFKNLKKILFTTADVVRIRLAENPNLVDLKFPNNITVGDGQIKIFKNSLLCPSKIKEFFSSVGRKGEWAKIQTELLSNGKNALCDILPYKIDHVNTTKNTAQIYAPSLVTLWNELADSVEDNLLGHSVYYQELKDKNTKLNYYLAASCDESAWSVETTWYSFEKKNNSILNNLKAYTYYAAYIQSVSIDPQGKTFVSDIVKFRTAPSEPSKVLDLKAKTLPNNSMEIYWKKPEFPNGKITHYKIVIIEQHTDDTPYNEINFCERKTTTIRRHEKPNETPEKRNDSSCEERKLEKKREQNSIEKQRELKKNLQHLQLAIMDGFYQKKKTHKQFNGSSFDGIQNLATAEPTVAFSEGSFKYITTAPTTAPETTEATDYEEVDSRKPIQATAYKTSYQAVGLRYSTAYTIEVAACHFSSKIEVCSKKATASELTGRKEGVDNIGKKFIRTQPINNGADILVKWAPPVQPNGYIYKYLLELKSEGRRIFSFCVSIPEYRKDHNGTVLKKKDFFDSGMHYLRIKASLKEFEGEWSEWVSIPSPTKDHEKKLINIVIVVVVVVVIVAAAVIFGFVWYQKKRKPPLDSLLYASINPDYFHITAKIYVPDEWEVDFEKIHMGEPIGEGAFGKVYKGTVRGLKDDQPDVVEPCAVKSLSDSATPRDKMEFLNEASVMKGLHCEHVVRLLGVMSKGSKNPLVLMELMINGDLKSYLRKHRPDDDSRVEPPSLDQIKQWAGEIADGMAYLADHKFVHRDLAARNCMVSEDKTVKVGDFGMTRDVYETDYYRKGNKGILPVRWMAPESLKDGTFTSQSDVFSFGVVLWEMATLAEQPYQGLSNDDVLNYVKAGNVMQMPQNCPQVLYKMMTECWRFKPKERPKFTDLIEHLLPYLNDKFKENSYFCKIRGYNSPLEEDTTEQSSTRQPRDFDAIQEDEEDDSRVPLTSQSRLNGSGDITEVNITGSKVKDGTNLANGHLSGIS